MKLMKKTTTPLALAVTAAALLAGTAAAAPVQGSISGSVTAVNGKTITVKTPANLKVPKNLSKVSVVSSTAITEEATGTAKNVKKGLCVTAMGTKNKKGVVTAQRVTLRSPVKGSCTGGFAGRGNRGGNPSNRQRPPGTGGGNGSGTGTGRRPPGGFNRSSANFGFASGTVSSVRGTTVVVKGQTATTTVKLVTKTQISRTLKVGVTAVKKGMCAFVYGSSADSGATVKASSVLLSKAGKNGCTQGFRGRPGAGSGP